MEKEIKVGDITMSQVEAAWDTLMKATDAIDEGIQSGDEGATQICMIICLRHMLFGARFHATTKIAIAKMEAKREAKVKEAVPVAKPEGVNFSLMPSGEKS